jgi:magnesium chelatase family protein
VIVGLPDAAVKESRDRVTTALINSWFTFTFGRTTINLAPADVKKEGPSFDLPIAVGMAAASEQLETDQLENFVMVGELALTGALAPVMMTRLPKNVTASRPFVVPLLWGVQPKKSVPV